MMRDESLEKTHCAVLCWKTTPEQGLSWSAVSTPSEIPVDIPSFPFQASLSVADSFLVGG